MKQDTLEGKAKTKNGIKRLCFSIICILLEVIFIITIVTRIVDCYNEGDVSTGMRIRFTALGTVSNPILLNVDTEEFIQIKNNKDIAAKSACGTPQALILYAERQEI